jgi:hypothetical protein
VTGNNPIEVAAGHHSVLCEAASGARSAPQEFTMEAGSTYPYKARVQ